MGFIESLLRQRKLLNSITRRTSRDLARTRQSFEQLEPRQLYSVTPLDNLSESLGISSLDLVASNSSGQFVAAWNDQDSGEFKISAFKSDGSSLLNADALQAVPSIDSFVTVTGIAFNNAGQGVIAGTSVNGIVALQFTISSGQLVFADNTVELAAESLPADQTISAVNVAIDGSGNFSLAWLGTGDMNVTPASGADPVVQNASSVYTARYNDTANTFGSVKTVWAASASTGSYTTAGSAIDIAVEPDGSSVIAWSTLSYTYKANPDIDGQYDAHLSTYATNFARYATNSTIIGAVTNISSQSMTGFDTVDSEQIHITMSSTGNFLVSQSGFATGTTDTGGDVVVNQKSLISFRSFSNSGKALSSLINLAESNDAALPYTFAYSANGNIVALWVGMNTEADSNVLYSQTYTNAGAKVGSAKIVDIGVNPVNSMVLVTTGDAYQLLYSGTDTESGENVINHVQLQDMKADLIGKIDGGTLPSTLTIGKDITGTLNITISNIGGYTYSGKTTLTLTLSADDVLGNDDDITITTAAYSLSIAADTEKTVTLSGIKIGKGVLPVDADGATYTAFVSIDAGAGNDMNTANNVVSTPVLIAAPNTIKDIASDDLIVSLPQVVLVPGDTGTATVIVRNTGNTDLTRDDVITVAVYARSTDDPQSEGYLIGTKQIRITLAAGATAKVTFAIKISDELPVGQYNFAAVLSMDGDASADNNTLALSESRSLVWDFGNVDGRKGLTKLVLTETDGTTVTFSLSGPGKGTVSVAEDGSYDLTLANTNTKTSVALTSKGGENTWGALHSITADNDIGSLTATTFTISGDISLAWIKALTLGDLTPDASHTLSINSESAAAVASITLGHAAGLTLTSTQAIGTLSILDTGGEGSTPIEIRAVSIDTIKTRVDKKQNSVGDFSGNITLTGKEDNIAFVALKSVAIAGDLHDSKFTIAGALKALAVTGSMTNTVVRATGNISAVSAESMISSTLFAGVADSVADTGAWPTSDADFANHCTIGAVTLKGAKNESHDFIISGFTVGTMKLGRIASSEGGTYGVFVAQADPATPKVKPFGSVSFSYMPAEATRAKSVAWTYKSTFTMPASVDGVSGFVLAAAPDQLP